MNRIEFVATIAIILFVAFALGWFCNWMVARMYRVTDKEIANLDEMGLALHTAEKERDQATTYLQQREAELMNQLTQTDAELTAAMGALRNSRLENEELRTYDERVLIAFVRPQISAGRRPLGHQLYFLPILTLFDWGIAFRKTHCQCCRSLIFLNKAANRTAEGGSCPHSFSHRMYSIVFSSPD